MLKRAGLNIVAALMTVAGAAACSSPLDTEERDVFGMEIVDGSGTVLASVTSARLVTGSLTTTPAGSTVIDVYFLDSDGDRFQIGPADDEHELSWEVDNESVAEIEASIEGYRLAGKVAGNTSAVFSVLHGGHSDYESPPIPITVAP